MTPCFAQWIPSSEVAYSMRFRYPSSPEYHILYVPSDSRRTNGPRADTESASPGDPFGSTTPAFPNTVPLTASCSVPSGVATTFTKSPVRKSCWDDCVQLPAAARGARDTRPATTDAITMVVIKSAEPRPGRKDIALVSADDSTVTKCPSTRERTIAEPHHKGADPSGPIDAFDRIASRTNA